MTSMSCGHTNNHKKARKNDDRLLMRTANVSAHKRAKQHKCIIYKVWRQIKWGLHHCIHRDTKTKSPNCAWHLWNLNFPHNFASLTHWFECKKLTVWRKQKKKDFNKKWERRNIWRNTKRKISWNRHNSFPSAREEGQLHNIAWCLEEFSTVPTQSHVLACSWNSCWKNFTLGLWGEDFENSSFWVWSYSQSEGLPWGKL